MKTLPRTLVWWGLVTVGIFNGRAESWPIVGLAPSQVLKGKTILMKTEAIQTLEPDYLEYEKEERERNNVKVALTGTFTQDLRSEGDRFLIEQRAYLYGGDPDVSAVSHDGKGMEYFSGLPNTGTILTFRPPPVMPEGTAHPYMGFNFRNAIFEWARWNNGGPRGGYAPFPFTVEQLSKAPATLAGRKSKTVVYKGQTVAQVELEAIDPLLEGRVHYKVFLSQSEGRCLAWTADSIMRDFRIEYEVGEWGKTLAPDGQEVIYPQTATFRLLQAYRKSGEYLPSITWQLRVGEFEILDTPGAEKFQIDRALAHTMTDMATGKMEWLRKR